MNEMERRVLGVGFGLVWVLGWRFRLLVVCCYCRRRERRKDGGFVNSDTKGTMNRHLAQSHFYSSYVLHFCLE